VATYDEVNLGLMRVNQSAVESPGRHVDLDARRRNALREMPLEVGQALGPDVVGSAGDDRAVYVRVAKVASPTGPRAARAFFRVVEDDDPNGGRALLQARGVDAVRNAVIGTGERRRSFHQSAGHSHHEEVLGLVRGGGLGRRAGAEQQCADQGRHSQTFQGFCVHDVSFEIESIG